MKNSPVILFDGVCNFCNGSVNFIIRRDRRSIIKFSALQSDKGLQLLRQYQLSTTDFDSFVLIENGRVYIRSTAALKVCRYLTGLWPFFYGFIIVPKFIRDRLYNILAKNRYKWFGKKESCMIPTPELRHKFL